MTDSGLTTLPNGKTTMNLCVVDLEMTHLDVKHGQILELAMIITDGHLNELERYSTAVYYEQLPRLSDFAQNIFEKNGLLARCTDSTKSLPMQQIKRDVADLLDRHRQGMYIMFAGSSVCYDQQFLLRYMPDVIIPRVHYRTVDVSSFLEMARRLNYELYQGCPRKSNSSHTAPGDADDSLQLLRYFKRVFTTLL